MCVKCHESGINMFTVGHSDTVYEQDKPSQKSSFLTRLGGQRHASAAVYPRGKDPRFPLYRRLGVFNEICLLQSRLFSCCFPGLLNYI
jgi:hypothetical protein